MEATIVIIFARKVTSISWQFQLPLLLASLTTHNQAPPHVLNLYYVYTLYTEKIKEGAREYLVMYNCAVVITLN